MPVPDCAPVNVSQVAELRAVHAQFVATAIDPLTPEVGADALAGIMATEQFCPGCVIATVRLLIRMFADRVVAVGLAATAKVIEPSPEPVAAL